LHWEVVLDTHVFIKRHCIITTLLLSSDFCIAASFQKKFRVLVCSIIVISIAYGSEGHLILSFLLFFLVSFTGCMPHDPSCVDGFLSSEKHFRPARSLSRLVLALVCKIWVFTGLVRRFNDGICYLH